MNIFEENQTPRQHFADVRREEITMPKPFDKSQKHLDICANEAASYFAPRHAHVKRCLVITNKTAHVKIKVKSRPASLCRSAQQQLSGK